MDISDCVATAYFDVYVFSGATGAGEAVCLPRDIQPTGLDCCSDRHNEPRSTPIYHIVCVRSPFWCVYVFSGATGAGEAVCLPRDIQPTGLDCCSDRHNEPLSTLIYKYCMRS